MSIGGGALFAVSSDIGQGDGVSMKDAPMGERTSGGRYKMPLLAGEQGTKSGGDWVPGGLQSMTNLASSISDTKALGWWETEQALIGLGLRADLAEELALAVNIARKDGVDFGSVKNHPEFRATMQSIAERAKDSAGANAARNAGINRHLAWEHNSRTGEEIGTPQINAEMGAVRELLAAAGFAVLPLLTERVVRNVQVSAAGRFDNILLHMKTGELFMADLKTKRKPFWTWLEMDAQLAGYANSEWMLTLDGCSYEPGPSLHVNLTDGVILHMPSDGSEPRLRRADLVAGWETLQLARRVCTARSYGRSAGRMAESWWAT